MLSKFFHKPVEFTIGEHELKFSSVADFDFSLAGRTAVPSTKITDMVKFSTDQLKKEARTIKDIEKKFVTILSGSIEDPNGINRSMRELDPLIFSQDHGWRDIVKCLNNSGDDLNEYRRIALAKYMQYLSSRQEIIKYLYNEKKKLLHEPNEVDSEAPSEFKETLLLDNTVFADADEDEERDNKAGNEKMPKGEAVTVVLTQGEEINIMLSKHKCLISTKGGLSFTDQAGRKYELKKGRNVVGRDTVSNVMMEPNLRDISRLHLVIENFGDNTLQLTDLSSHGTYLPNKYIQQHST